MNRPRLIHGYVLLMTAAAAAGVAMADWSVLVGLSGDAFLGFLILVLVGILTEHQSVTTLLGDRRGAHSITFIPLSTSVVLFGPAAPVAFMMVVGTIAEFIIRKKPLDRGVFNVSQWLVSASLAGALFSLLGGEAQVLVDSWDLSDQLPPFIAFGLALLFCNQAFVSLAISLSQGLPFGEVARKMAGPAGATAAYDLLISPVALVVAFLFLRADWPGLVLACFPMLFIRRAYLLNFQLQQANRSLLKALVKAIETRDPYTSGHSLRVQALAGRIVRVMGLPEYRRRNIEQAALLHDIGKIDAIYTEILKKPESLSSSERQVIESHVTKGVELLTSISSFPREVIDAVRYHHEREDGNGYPHGLVGSDIPLGAKIINVCDAIDAMLSDRPYRKALSIDTVRDELLRYSGVQFDSSVVADVISGDLLEKHAEAIKMDLDLETLDSDLLPPVQGQDQPSSTTAAN